MGAQQSSSSSGAAGQHQEKLVPRSVNYHFTRKCNYSCGFCFHTAKTSYVLPIENAKEGLLQLKHAGMEKLNFSGGEPFLYPKFLGELARYCKQDLQLASVTIVSNGSKIKEEWIAQHAPYIDILAVSCDSFDEETNRKIGRWCPGSEHIEQLFRVRNMCEDYNIKFKVNTTVCTHNVAEDMHEAIAQLNPCRWKVFQCLLIEGENCGPDALRQAEAMAIDDHEFDRFIDRHRDIDVLVPESNDMMRNSYLILDEYMRFLNNVDGRKVPGRSILDVGVDAALNQAGFDEVEFKKRGGVYNWSKLADQLQF